MNKKAVAEKATTDLATDDLWGDFAGEGLDNVGETDVLIPRLTILQGLSPQLNKSKSEFIKGASVGDICDVGVREFWSDGVLFLPVYFNKCYIEWAPRESGQGLIAIHDDPTVLERLTGENERGQKITAEGHTIAEISQFFGYNLTAGGRKCFIPFSSTQMKKARQWNTLAMSEKAKRADGSEFTPPLWYRAYQLGSGPESNNRGEWEGWTIERGPKFAALGFSNPNEMFQNCKDFMEALKAGDARADNTDMESEHKREKDGDAF